MHALEVRYLSIVWTAPDNAIKVEKSRDPVPIDESSSGLRIETTTFPKTGHFIGFRIVDDVTKHAPYLKLSNGNQEELIPVKDPGSRDVWWIQSSGWDGHRHLSELYRSAGRAELVIQNSTLIIENDTLNFSVSDLEYYLSDFKNNLWMLFLDQDSPVKGSGLKQLPNYFGDDVVRIFHEFTQRVEKVIQAPGMTLVESQGKRPLRSVRPIPRTFREYVIQPNARFLTSRTYLNSYDTPENRYIHYTVKRSLYILKSLSRLAVAQIQSCLYKIEQEKKWLANASESQTKRIDKRVFENEISKLTGDIVALEQRLSNIVSNATSDNHTPQHTEAGTYTLQLGDPYGNSSTTFFGNRINGKPFRHPSKAYLLVRFPFTQLTEEDRKALRQHELHMTGRYSKHKIEADSARPHFELIFHELNRILIGQDHRWRKELNRLVRRRDELERTDWIAPLSNEDRNDRVIESRVAEDKLRFYQDLQQYISNFSASIPALQARLEKVRSFFARHRVKTQSDCPNSMTFIQNPAYASAKSHFRRLATISGLDESILNSLMMIDEIGLVSTHNFYEKWCLLQIISVLTRIYGFHVEDGWEKLLIDAVLKQQVDTTIKLECPKRQQRIELTYEKTLSSGKRPDFVLDLFSMEYEADTNDSNRWVIAREICSRLIMDAKFRGRMDERALQKLVTELYTDKDYSEGGVNQVFIIFPSPNAITQPTSPLEWGTYCDYGQSDEGRHRKGGIFVSPSMTHARSLEHLQRLLGMFIQQNSEILKAGWSSVFWHNMLCISCGNIDQKTFTISHQSTGGGQDKWIMKCQLCELITVQTICFSCRHPLFKTGQKWTYHRTRAEQISNVVCPKCETFL